MCGVGVLATMRYTIKLFDINSYPHNWLSKFGALLHLKWIPGNLFSK